MHVSPSEIVPMVMVTCHGSLCSELRGFIKLKLCKTGNLFSYLLMHTSLDPVPVSTVQKIQRMKR